MKKIKLDLSKLQFDKEKISSLQDANSENLMGGQAAATAGATSGCSDGCWPVGTFYNCTECSCSLNCSQAFCPATNTGYPGTLC